MEAEIQRILSAHWFVHINTKDPSRQLLMMRHPTLHETRVCEFYRQRYIDLHKEKLISQEEATSKAIIHKQWHPALDLRARHLYEQYEQLKEEIKRAKEQYKRIASFRTHVKRLEHQIQAAEKELTDLLERKNNIFANTLEFRAERHFVSRLVGFITQDVHQKPLWSGGDISGETATELIETLINEYLNTQTLDTPRIRSVARNNLWRYRWQLGKGDPKSLFGRNVQDLSPEQNLLVFWSQVYDMVYESYEPPPQYIIEDDEKFDAWLEKKAKEGEAKRSKDYYGLNKQKKQDGNEQFVFVDGYYDNDGYWVPYSEEEKRKKAEAIYSQNAPIIRQMQRVGNRRLDEAPGTFIRETHLRKGWFKVLGWDRIK